MKTHISLLHAADLSSLSRLFQHHQKCMHLCVRVCVCVCVGGGGGGRVYVIKIYIMGWGFKAQRGGSGGG